MSRLMTEKDKGAPSRLLIERWSWRALLVVIQKGARHAFGNWRKKHAYVVAGNSYAGSSLMCKQHL